MSSAVYIHLRQPVIREKWLDFCEHHGIIYSPRTIGRNVFYQGNVEICFGKTNYSDQPWQEAKPPEVAEDITVSGYYMSNLEAIAEIARRILIFFGGRYECDAELESLVKTLIGQNKE